MLVCMSRQTNTAPGCGGLSSVMESVMPVIWCLDAYVATAAGAAFVGAFDTVHCSDSLLCHIALFLLLCYCLHITVRLLF